MSHGVTVPQITFKYRVRDASIGGDNPFRWQDITRDDCNCAARSTKYRLLNKRNKAHEPWNYSTPNHF